MRSLINIGLLLVFLLTGCKGNKMQELTKWNVTLQRDDKRPYGTYLAYESLKYYFPNAVIDPLSKGFGYDNMDTGMKHNYTGRSLMVLQGLDFYVSDDEWEALKDFIASGNEVVIFGRVLDSKIEEELGYYKRMVNDEESPADASEQKQNKDVLFITTDLQQRYGYEGRTLRGYFAMLDKPGTLKENETEESDSTTENDSGDTSKESKTIYGDTLGYTGDKVNFIRFRLGNGHLTLHAAPLVLSNYFLLQPGNINYLTAIWQTLPPGITKIYWNEYYKRSIETSALDVLLRYPATRLALLVGVLALLVYVLFESKRKQRIIPVIPPIKNDSVSFVETVGRLYYNKGDHKNLAGKMVQQFLEWVRIHYLLNTNLLNEQFTEQLIIKSGQPEPVVREMMRMIQEIKTNTITIDEPYLYQLYNTIQHFYKNNRS